MNLRFGTRGSRLALMQTRYVMDRLSAGAPGLSFSEVIIKTLGDRVTDQPLFKVGGQGLFIKELEQALIDDRVDLAVHSLKDMPFQLGRGLILAATGPREDPRDVLISARGLSFAELPKGSLIGTSSLRRRAQIAALRPDLKFCDLRGNIDTRLRKLDDEHMDAIVLAAAGLIRLGLEYRITEFFPVDKIIPAAGQGILGIECRRSDIERFRTILAGFDDPASESCALAERAFLGRIQGGCQVPVGVFASRENERIHVIAFLGAVEGLILARTEVDGGSDEAERLGLIAAENLLKEAGLEAVPRAKKREPGTPNSVNEASGIASDIAPGGDVTAIPAASKGAGESPQILPKASGKVFLVGAGPGHPGLITVRGLELVRNADSIVHDQLGAPGFLAAAREDAELIDVGKRSADHTLPQEGINELLVQKAREGKMVVRLKGGDPLIFGRGGEEMEALAGANVDFEVVPGVSSAVAGPAFAGIPTTHRGFSPAVAFVTGHEADLKGKSTIPWESLSGIDSLVFLMGVKNLSEIARNLIGNGKSPHTPVAVIENATSPRQRTVVGTLANIPIRASEAHIKPPALIVVGPAVSMREKLGWFEKKPLFGKTFIVTRSRAQAGEQADALRDLGADVIEFPVIRLEPIAPNPDFERFLGNLDTFRHLVFTSVNGVDAFLAGLLASGLDARSLKGKRIVCIGPATAARFRDVAILPDFVPDTYVAESLLPFFNESEKGEVAILRAEKARETLPEELRKLGFKVTVIPLYRTLPERGRSEEVIRLLRSGSVSAVTFASSSTVERFLEAIEGSGIEPGGIPAVAIGPITAGTCRTLGLNLLAVADESTIPGLVEKLRDRFQSGDRKVEE